MSDGGASAPPETPANANSQGGSSEGGSGSGGHEKRDLTKQDYVISFSGFPDDAARYKMVVSNSLKGRVEEKEMPLCTHVVCVQPLKRTVKLCAAISLPSVTLVTSDWIKACESAKSFVDPKPYTLSGVQCHGKAWEFNVSASLENRQKKKHGCLHGTELLHHAKQQAGKPHARFRSSDGHPLRGR